MAVKMLSIKDIQSLIDVEVQEISSIVYRNDDFGIEGMRFKHIDVDMCYGEFMELHEEEALYQKIYSLCDLAEVEDMEEVVVFQKI